MEQQVVTIVSTAMAAKILAGFIRRDYGYTVRHVIASAHSQTQADLAYLLAMAVGVLVVRQAGVEASLLVAMLLQAGLIVGDRLLLSANHLYLELFVAAVCYRLLGHPGALVSALQIMTVTVWVYAAFQKVYHREFLDGSFFYVLLERNARLARKQWWTRALPVIPPIEGYYGAVDQRGQTFCRRFAAMVVVLEAVVPVMAFAASGTFWGFGLLAGLAIPISLLIGETSFLITSLLLTLTFLVPFDPSALSAIGADRVVLGMLLWCLLWPPVHALLTRRYGFSSWKLAGWGMFATLMPRVDVVDARGLLVSARAIPSASLLTVAVCGACRIRWVREYAARSVFRLCRKDQVNGLLLRWYRKRGNRYVTECLWLPNTAGAMPLRCEVDDARSEHALRQSLTSCAAH